MRGKFFTVEEVAQLLGITPGSVRRRIRRGHLYSQQPLEGRRHFIPESEIMRLRGMTDEEKIINKLKKIEEDVDLLKTHLIGEIRNLQRLTLFLVGELRYRRKQDGI